MEISPAKSLGIVSDSEGEEDRTGISIDDIFEREVNAAKSTDPRDGHHLNQPATIATNLSSHISQFATLPGQARTMQADSSVIGEFGSDATKPRPRPRPRMRPVPPPDQPESSISTFPSIPPAIPSAPETVASFDNSAVQGVPAACPPSLPPSNPHPSSALDEAEEYTGRGARRLGQPSKHTLPPPFSDVDVDVGGPEDNTVNDVIMLISSDDEYSASKVKAKAKPKPKPKPKPKKDTPKADSTPAQTDTPVEQALAPAKTASKRKATRLQSSDDEFGKWDTSIPGGSAPTGERKKAGIPDSGDKDGSSAQPVVPNTIDPPNPNPIDGPGYVRATSSPLSSPGRSPELKRKDPPNPVADETAVQSPAKKPRTSGFVGVVLAGPSSDRKKPKRAKKKPTKAAAAEGDDGSGNDQAYVPPALSSVADTSTSVMLSESSKTKTTPPTSGEPSMVVQEPENAPTDIDPVAAAKKQPKKRAPKGKKGATTEEPAVADGSAQEDPAPKKGAKGKGKGKGKEKEPAPEPIIANDEVAGASSSNPDASVAPATSSNPNSNTGPQPTSSNPSAAPAQTPAPKPKARPRHSTTPAPLPVAMGASGALRSASGKSSDRPLSETLRLAFGGSGSPAPRMGLSRRGSSKIAPLLAFRGAPPPPPPPMPKKPTKKKKGDSDDEDSEEGPEWEGLTEKQKEKKRREKEIAGWYSDG
ncbi:hypothetical protein FRC11_000719 [Ceratobasidium sp. 423]|nr:hypothetical protein FRC11_000719 [Ceratobasidium sp. 423]